MSVKSNAAGGGGINWVRKTKTFSGYSDHRNGGKNSDCYFTCPGKPVKFTINTSDWYGWAVLFINSNSVYLSQSGGRSYTINDPPQTVHVWMGGNADSYCKWDVSFVYDEATE